MQEQKILAGFCIAYEIYFLYLATAIKFSLCFCFFRKISEEDFCCYEDVFDPLIHQRIAILFGSFSPKSPNAPLFCVRPWVVQMEHYGSNDMTLGEFLKR